VAAENSSISLSGDLKALRRPIAVWSSTELGPELNHRDDEAADGQGRSERPRHEAVNTPRQLLEALVHLLQDGLDQLALVLELILDAHHALAQLRSQRLLGELLPEILLDVRDVFRGEVRDGHWHSSVGKKMALTPW